MIKLDDISDLVRDCSHEIIARPVMIEEPNAYCLRCESSSTIDDKYQMIGTASPFAECTGKIYKMFMYRRVTGNRGDGE